MFVLDNNRIEYSLISPVYHYFDIILDPIIAIPISWPKGTYSLVKPNAGCPNTHFKWAEGWRLQDTENSNPNNYWSDPLHVAGERATDDMTRHFCSKTMKDEDMYGWIFQPGQYCIGKKGPQCPLGKHNNLINLQQFSIALCVNIN